MDFHKEWRQKLLVICERYLNGEFDLPEFQQRLSTTSALLPKEVSANLQRLLDEFEHIRFTQLETNHMSDAESHLKDFMVSNSLCY